MDLKEDYVKKKTLPPKIWIEMNCKSLDEERSGQDTIHNKQQLRLRYKTDKNINSITLLATL